VELAKEPEKTAETTATAEGPAKEPEKASETTPDVVEPIKKSEETAETPTVVTKPAEEPEKTATKPVEKKASPIEELWAVAKANGHPEIWGVTLADPATSVPTQIVLQKYLNANDGDLIKAKDQLTKTLEWRAKTKPLELMEMQFNRSKFAGLGYVTTFGAVDAPDPEVKEVITWNIYGSVKNVDATFGNLGE